MEGFLEIVLKLMLIFGSLVMLLVLSLALLAWYLRDKTRRVSYQCVTCKKQHR